MQKHAIETCGLTRRFGAQLAVDDLNLLAPEAGVYGFLGPNGAGKTTTIRMLLGLIRPDAGEVRLFGAPLAAGRLSLMRMVGALVETPSHLGQRPLARIRIGARRRHRRNLLRHLRGRRAGGQILSMAAAGECFPGGEIYGRASAGRRRRSDCGGDWLLGICQAGCGLAEAGVAFHAIESICSRTIRMPSHAGHSPASLNLTICSHQYASSATCFCISQKVFREFKYKPPARRI